MSGYWLPIAIGVVMMLLMGCGVSDATPSAPVEQDSKQVEPPNSKVIELEERLSRLEQLHPTPTPTPGPDAAATARAIGVREARRAEFNDVATAVTSLMTENRLSAIPNPVSGGDSHCTEGTRDMTAFPDNTSVAGGADKLTDPNSNPYTTSDKDGYLLFGHDIIGDSSTAGTVNYVNFNVTTYCYSAEANGTVHQHDSTGDSERSMVQAAMTAMRADKGKSTVTAETGTARNDWTTYPTGPTGTIPLGTGGYMAVTSTTWFYCWDTKGKITDQLDTAAACP